MNISMNNSPTSGRTAAILEVSGEKEKAEHAAIAPRKLPQLRHQPAKPYVSS